MYQVSARTTPSRHRERARYDSGTIHEILDQAIICHVGFVVDGRPVVLPTAFARVDDRLYLHASTGSRPILRASRSGGLPICMTVSIVDGLVLARSATHHSLAYRSVVAHGVARMVVDEAEKDAALAAIVDRTAPGRSADCRPPSPRERAAVAVLRLDLVEVSAKVRGGEVNDEAEDYESSHWAGFIPLRTAYGPALPAPDLRADIAIPANVRRLTGEG